MLAGLTLVLAFASFAALIWAVHRLNRYGLARYGYEPFAPPNAALMCVPAILFYSALADLNSISDLFGAAEPVALVKLVLWVLFLLAMLGLLAWRSNGWIALFAAPVLALAAPVVLMTVFYQRLTR
jgi:hypothetical protein